MGLKMTEDSSGVQRTQWIRDELSNLCTVPDCHIIHTAVFGTDTNIDIK